MRRRVIFFISVLLLLLVAVPGVLALVHIDADGQVPFYARAPRDGLIHDGEWVVVVFYRPASCIPADFNLLDFFDFPGATGPGAIATQGKSTADNASAFGFQWKRSGRSSKHMRFNWSGPSTA